MTGPPDSPASYVGRALGNWVDRGGHVRLAIAAISVVYVAAPLWLLAITVGAAGINPEAVAFILVLWLGLVYIGWRWYRFAAPKW